MQSVSSDVNRSRRVRLCFLGRFRLEVDGESKDSLPYRGQLLLLRLATSQTGVSRLAMAQLLWPEVPSERASFYLRRTLSQVRSSLAGEKHLLVENTNHILSLDRNEIECDVTTFVQLAKSKDLTQHAAACEMYIGPLLARSEEWWVEVEREDLRKVFLSSLLALAQEDENRRDLEAARVRMLRALSESPLDEEILRRTMTVLGQLKAIPELTRVYSSSRRRFEQTLGTQFSIETRKVFRDLVKNSTEVPKQIEDTPSHSGLLVPIPQMFGREDDITNLCKMLSGHRVVSLVGLGGVGKTTLALALAHQLADKEDQKVEWIEFPSHGLGSPMVAIAEKLGIPFSGPEDVLDIIAADLNTKPRIVFLDSGDRPITDGLSFLTGLASRVPESKFVTVSRVSPNILGGAVIAVQPLDYGTDSSRVLESSAGKLFLTQARLSRQDFEPDEENSQDIFALCRLLDGLPLAIEMAAVRIRTTPLKEVVRQISSAKTSDTSFHRIVSSSLEVLDQETVDVFQRLGVFGGSWTLSEAFEICGDSLGYDEFAAILAKLADHSLVVLGADQRYSLFQVCRSAARQGLDAKPSKAAEVRRRFADFYCRLIRSSDIPPRSVEAKYAQEAIERLVELAVECREPNVIRSAMHSVATSIPKLQRQGAAWQGYEFAKALLEIWPGEPEDAVAELMIQAAAAAHSLFRFDEAAAILHRVKQVLTSLDIALLNAYCLLSFGDVSADQGRIAEAKGFLEQAHAEFGEIGDSHGQARARASLGYIARESGEFETAEQLTEKALAIFISEDDAAWQAWCIGSLAGIYMETRQDAKAETYLRQSLEIQRKLGNLNGVAWNFTMLGIHLMRTGHLEVAIDHLQQAIEIHRSETNSLAISWPLEQLGEAFTLQGKYGEALEILEEAKRIHLRSGQSKVNGHIYVALSKLNLALGNVASARAYLSLAEASLKTVENNILLLDVEDLRTRLAASLADVPTK